MTSEFEEQFAAYFDEIERCRTAKCYWALLHILVVLPDICGALESENGKATPRKHHRWCAYFGQDPTFTPVDRYALRCVLLHQGRTVTTWGQYGSYSFLQPTPSGPVDHRLVADFGRYGKNLPLDVDKLAAETVQAIRAWFADLQQPTNARRLQHVRKHVRWLARESKRVIRGAPGVIFMAPTTSGTGGFASP
jgi:hypothetical protein